MSDQNATELTPEEMLTDMLLRAIPLAEDTLVAVKEATSGPLLAYAVLTIARVKLKAMIGESGWQGAVIDVDTAIEERISVLVLPKHVRMSPGGQS